MKIVSFAFELFLCEDLVKCLFAEFSFIEHHDTVSLIFILLLAVFVELIVLRENKWSLLVLSLFI